MSPATAANHYDAIILGSGQGGNPLSKALAQAGWRTAMIERKFVGGTCVNTGCTPTKTMVGSARVAYMASRAEYFGIHAQVTGVNMARILERKNEIVLQAATITRRHMLSTKNLDLIYGDGTLHRAQIHLLSRKTTVTNSTSPPTKFSSTPACARPCLPSLVSIRCGLCRTFSTTPPSWNWIVCPTICSSLAADILAWNLARCFAASAAASPSFKPAPSCSRMKTPTSSTKSQKFFAKMVSTFCSMQKLSASAETKTKLRSKFKPATNLKPSREHICSSPSVARPIPTSSISPPLASRPTTDGFLRVNSSLETNVPGVYGIGDVKGGPAFTHISYDDFRILRDNLLHGKHHTTDGRMLPYTVFIDPQLGRIGITEKEARQQGIKIRVAKMPMTSVARAREFGETRGLMKILVDPDSKQILGAAILGMEGGEMAAMVQLAMMGKIPYPVLQEGIFSHPTLSESLNVIFGHFED